MKNDYFDMRDFPECYKRIMVEKIYHKSVQIKDGFMIPVKYFWAFVAYEAHRQIENGNL